MSDPTKFRYPDIDERLTILGTTGSGKTTLAGHVLSRAPFDQMPFIAIDYKGDELLGSIDRMKEIGIGDRIPKDPGLYLLRALPSWDDEMEAWLWKVWERGHVGLYIDEAYLLPNRSAIKNILAQGRSLRIPVIAASQRPFDVPRSLFSEAQHIAVFRLTDDDDKKRVRQFTPKGMIDRLLPDYHCFWYSVKHHKAGDPRPYYTLSPVPDAATIVGRINERLAPSVRVT